MNTSRPRPRDFPSNTPEFGVSRTDTGFRAVGVSNAKSPLQAGALVRLRVAYEVSRGSPLKSYQEQDFRLHGPDALPVQVQGASIETSDVYNQS